MLGSRKGATEQLNVFEIDGRYLLKHYFDDTDIYGEMRQYYNNNQYRFEIPEDDISDVLTFLSQEGFDMYVVDDLDPYVVAVRKYRDHPENIFKESVMQRSTVNYHCFLMKDEAAVKYAVKGGGVPVAGSDINNPFIETEED